MAKMYSGVNPYVLRQLKHASKKKILDIGCGTGKLGEILESRGNIVKGIEMYYESAARARKRISEVIQEDAVYAIPKINEQFDYIIMSDFLEHIEKPLNFLKELRKNLNKGGKIIVSVPNVANFSIRLSLLLGKFDYKHHGIMDETHLRFFTLKTLRELTCDAGYSIRKVDAIPTVPARLKGTPLEKALALIARVWKTLFAYQFVMVAEVRS